MQNLSVYGAWRLQPRHRLARGKVWHFLPGSYVSSRSGTKVHAENTWKRCRNQMFGCVTVLSNMFSLWSLSKMAPSELYFHLVSINSYWRVPLPAPPSYSGLELAMTFPGLLWLESGFQGSRQCTPFLFLTIYKHTHIHVYIHIYIYIQ